MFEYYQVNKIYGKFIPQKWESGSSTGGTNKVVASPTWSIVDPEIDAPQTPSGFYSYGNCHETKPYAVNERRINYINLGL
jgi:hypothetical protein